MTLYEERKKVVVQLNALKDFTDTRTVRQLRRELQMRLEHIHAKIEKQKQPPKKRISKTDIQREANMVRAGKMH